MEHHPLADLQMPGPQIQGKQRTARAGLPGVLESRMGAEAVPGFLAKVHGQQGS